MSFFHNLNKTLDSIAAKPEAAQLNERDMGKHNNGKTTGFKAVADKAAKEYGSKAAGERVAGAVKAVKAKMAKSGKLEEQNMDEGLGDMAKKVGGIAKKVGGAVLNKVGHGDDVDMIRDLQKKMGVAQTGKKPTAKKPADLPHGYSGSGQEKADWDKWTGRSDYEESAMPPKQKAFAALAEPKDKITFADKIAGAKKEVDEMLGDVAAEAMRNALGKRQQVADEGNAFTGKLKATPKGGKFKMGNKEYTDTSGVDESYDDEDDVYAFQDPSKKKTHKTATGGTVTRHGGVTRHQAAPGHYGGFDPETDPDKDDDKPGAPAGEKRGRGRPKGAPKGPERVTAKAYKHKGVRKMSEEEIQEAIASLEECGYSVTALEEESTTKRDNRAEKAGKKVTKDIEYDEKKKDGIHGNKRGAEDSKAERAGKKVAKDIEHDEKEDAPKKSKSKFKFGGSVYESLDAQLETLIAEDASGSVGGKEALAKEIYDLGYNIHQNDHGYAQDTSQEEAKLKQLKAQFAQQFPGEDAFKLGSAINDREYQQRQQQRGDEFKQKQQAATRSTGIMQKAKNAIGGMFEDLDESMSVNLNTDTEGHKSLTVNASDEDAERLAELLKMAGVSQHQETCSACGESDCGCDMVDENSPNWPSNQETSDDAMQYSGGLNGPKSTGQSTVPVLASQLRRQVSMEESAKVEQNLLNLYRTFGK